MPNQPKTPKVGWRIPLDLRKDMEWVAGERRETVTALVIRALRREVEDYFAKHGRRRD